MVTAQNLIIAAIVLTSGTAHAEGSANVGWASEYYYRGVLQKSSSASAGLDYESNGFYAGTWAADVGDGLEIDGYFGYGGEIEDVSYSIGFTGYYYTGDFDDTYQEIYLNTGYGIATIDVAIGEYGNFDGPTQDYAYYSLTLAHEGFYGKVGGFSQDFEGNYVEAGYETSIEDFDVSVAAIFSDSDLVGNSDEALVITIGKSFDLQ